MASKYWIKLYHEILDDPKMGLLTDRAYRRVIELFLLAGRIDDDGNLPCTQEIAWTLRQNPAEIEGDLQHLASVGILTANEDGTWLVTHFNDRQAPVSDAERMKRYRDRKQKTGDVTAPLPNENASVTPVVTKRNADTDLDTDLDTPKGGDKRLKSKNKSKVSTPAQEMFSALARLCQYDISIISEKERGQLNQAESKMRENGYSPPDLDAFGVWWYANDWRGQKGQPPTLGDVRSSWGKFRNGVTEKSNGAKNGHSQPDETTTAAAQRERLIAEIKAHGLVPDLRFSGT